MDLRPDVKAVVGERPGFVLTVPGPDTGEIIMATTKEDIHTADIAFQILTDKVGTNTQSASVALVDTQLFLFHFVSTSPSALHHGRSRLFGICLGQHSSAMLQETHERS